MAFLVVNEYFYWYEYYQRREREEGGGWRGSINLLEKIFGFSTSKLHHTCQIEALVPPIIYGNSLVSCIRKASPSSIMVAAILLSRFRQSCHAIFKLQNCIMEKINISIFLT
jgi:hypothetical protein